MPGYRKIAAPQFGGPEVLEIAEIATLPQPGPGEVRLRVEAAGVGYTDTILRRGRYIYYQGGLPATPGYDVVGVVDALGAGVEGLKIGQRVADMPVSGSYSQYMLRPAETLVPVPDGLAPELAVEAPLMWMTAWQMLKHCASLKQGDSILAVGASGSVGRGLVALGRALGLNVIGTSSSANVPLVQSLGATALDYRRLDLLQAIKDASGGGVAAAFDAIGGISWETSWAALRQNGVLVGYGSQDFLESGGPTEVIIAQLGRFNVEWNALGKTDGTGRSTTFYDIGQHRKANPAQFHDDMVELFKLMLEGVAPPPPEILPLDQAAEAHRRIASGGLKTRLVLKP